MPFWKKSQSPRPNTAPSAPTNSRTRKQMKDLQANGITRDESPSFGNKDRRGSPVSINIYNLMNPESNGKFNFFGVGIFHSGVVIRGKEWSFGGSSDAPNPQQSGIFYIPPRTALPPELFHSSVEVGETTLTDEQINWIISGMAKEWTVSSYHVLSRNCNHFGEEFLVRLGKAGGCKYPYPSWVNRAAKLGDKLIPSSLVEYALGQLPQPPPEGSQAPSSTPAAKQPPPEEPYPIPQDLASLPVRKLRTIMFVHGINWEGCVEKSDMIQRIEDYVKKQAGKT